LIYAGSLPGAAIAPCAAFLLHGCVLVGAAQFCLSLATFCHALLLLLVGRCTRWLVSVSTTAILFPGVRWLANAFMGFSHRALLSPSIAAFLTKLRHAAPLHWLHVVSY
jgi:hypothetical protein